MKIEKTRNLIVLSLIVFFHTNLFSQETKCECYSKSGVTEETGIGGWTSIIGYNREGEQLQYHFYAAYFPPQELCIPRDNFWWQEVEAAILKAIKSHPIYKSSQTALETDDPTATPTANSLSGQAFITKKEVARIEGLPGTVVSVDAYIQERFASKLDLCSDIDKEKPTTKPNVNNDQSFNLSNSNTSVRSENNAQNTNAENIEQTKLNDAQNFIDAQNQQKANQERLNQKLANDLTQTFNQISNSWAKERDYQSKISSLTNIKSIDASSIISEARSKAQQINIEYNRKKDDALNQGVSATQTLINSAENEKQAIAGGLLGAGLTAVSQASIEKERKDSQEKLENEKQQILKQLSQQIIDKFEPLIIQHLEAAKYAMEKENEDYHLAQFQYAKCMSDNAYDIIRGSSNYCSEPKTKNIINKKYTSQSYYEAYKRKSKSLIPEIQNKAGYFLELAIKKEPTNTKWLLEKLNTFDLSTLQQLAIMKRCLEIDKNNLELEKKYTKKLRLYSNIKFAIESNKNDIKIIKEQKVKDLNSEFEDVKFVSDNVFLVAKFSGKTSKQWKSNYILLKETVREKLYGLVDSSGNIIAPIKYKEIGEFSEGKATALVKNKYGFINLKGETVIPLKFNFRPTDFKNGYSIIEKSDIIWNLMFDDDKTFKLFIDSSGKEINGKKYDDLYEFSDGLALTGKSKLISYDQNFINQKGDVEIPLDKYYGVNPFYEGMAAVRIKSTKSREQYSQKWGFINTSGDIIIDCIYDDVSSFVNNQAIVQKNNKKGIIDKQNAILIPIEYDDISIVDSQAIVQKNKKKGIIDRQNGITIPLKYDEIYPFVNGYALIVIDNKTGLINKQNEMIVPHIYDASYNNNDMNLGAIIPNYIFLKKNNKWGVLNKKGEVVVDFKYNNKETIFELFD